ncbi:hypothetical protein evm_014230 [Chilo suppressalis]|nr:hypothetical protein evm_014230 [Chilo suppressalis]
MCEVISSCGPVTPVRHDYDYKVSTYQEVAERRGCSYDFLEITEPGSDNSTEHAAEEWLLEDHHDGYSSENEVWDESEYLLPESDASSAGWSRDAHAVKARRLCGDWGGKLKLLRHQSRGNQLRLRFRSDHSRHYAGYKAKITLADCEYFVLNVTTVLYYDTSSTANIWGCGSAQTTRDTILTDCEYYFDQCGDWGGKLKLLRHQSRGNQLRLRFRSDHSRHYAGYKAKITLADCEYCLM